MQGYEANISYISTKLQHDLPARFGAGSISSNAVLPHTKLPLSVLKVHDQSFP